MNKLYFLLIFLLINYSCFAQGSTIDSLNLLINRSEDDTTRVQLMLELSQQFLSSDPQKTISISEQAKEISERHNYRLGITYSLKNIGIGYYMQGDYMVAIEYWQLALNSFEKEGNLEGIANLQSNIGAAYGQIGDEAKAIEFYIKSLKISEEIDNPNRIATALMNIGATYSWKPSTSNKALEYYWKALPYCLKSGDAQTIGNIFSNLGEIHYQMNNNDSALYYFEKSLVPNKDSPAYSYSLNYMGRVFAEKGELLKAIELQKEAIAIAEKFNAKLELSIALIGLANTYIKQGDPSLAMDKFKEAQKIAREIGSLNEIKEAYEGLSTVYAEKFDFRNAYKFEVLLNDLKDTIYDTETDEKIKGLQFGYELDKKEAEIELKDSEIERARILKNFLLVGSVFLILIISGVIYQYRLTKRSNKIITREKIRSEKLLLNILPKEVAEELKAKGIVEAKQFDLVSVLFTDFKGFSNITKKLNAHELVAELNVCFEAFDKIVTSHKIEKIKTIGDSYMAAGGLHTPRTSTTKDVIMAALEMQAFIKGRKSELENQGKPFFEMRAGVNTGSVVAGVVGSKKYQYDIWGDTVNIASQMESSGEAGRVNISQYTYELIKNDPTFTFENRGNIEVKGKEELEIYFVKLIQKA